VYINKEGDTWLINQSRGTFSWFAKKGDLISVPLKRVIWSAPLRKRDMRSIHQWERYAINSRDALLVYQRKEHDQSFKKRVHEQSIKKKRCVINLRDAWLVHQREGDERLVLLRRAYGQTHEEGGNIINPLRRRVHNWSKWHIFNLLRSDQFD
jgi:hypothetical protein